MLGDSGSPILNVPKVSQRKKRETEDRDLTNEDYSQFQYPDDYQDLTNAGVQSKTTAIRYIQQGIVSFGERKDCGHGGRPGVYTNVHQYLRWILDNARPHGE
jgi:secreted trypsin-like serine protease